MISDSSHAVNGNLNQSIHDFRNQLDQSRNTQLNYASIPEKPENQNPPVNELPPSEQAPIDYKEIAADVESRVQSNKDDARQAAVHAIDLNNQKNVVDTYMDASSNDEDSDDNEPYNYDPQNIYETSMNYSRNASLMNAFETVAKNGADNHHVSIMV